jgi:hypothetical protein
MARFRTVGSSFAALSLSLLVVDEARAKDVGEVAGDPVRVDITETSYLNYHVDNRNDVNASDVDKRLDDNYGSWVNRFNVSAAWKAWQAGLRFDTATYFHRPKLSQFEEGAQRDNAAESLRYRLRDTYVVSPFLPSKLYLTYAKPDVEITAGDGYVSFGRGMVLTIRKIDELAADTSLQGAKVIGRLKPFTLTAVAGLANPVRFDEATGVVLRDPAATIDSPYRNTWSRDLIAGARAEAKMGTSTIGLQIADIHRRDDLQLSGDPVIISKDITNGGVSLAIPKIADALPLNLYTELAVQKRSRFEGKGDATTDDRGYAAYAALSMKTGIVTSSFEGKHYRGYYAAKLNADNARYSAFSAVQYMTPPTVERITQDSLFDNSCTTGGRARIDVQPTKTFLAYFSAAYFANWGERSPTSCAVGPAFGVTNIDGRPPTLRNDIWDGYIGFELRSAHDASYLLMTGGVRHDVEADTSKAFYRETWVEYDLVKTLDLNYSVELSGRVRNRYEGTTFDAWHEGENVVALKYTSKRSVFIGHEFTTRSINIRAGENGLFSGLGNRNSSFLSSSSIQHFLNVGAQIKFSDNVMLRVLVGQQRGALKCVSGVCRLFPAFEGAKSELIINY